MLATIKKTGNGVNKDLLASELLPGQWSDCMNMRFRNDFAEKFRGIQAVYNTPAVVPYWIETYISQTARFLVYSGVEKAYCDDGLTASEITPYSDWGDFSAITFVGTTATAKVKLAHTRTTGETVIVYGATPAAYNGTFVITVSPTLPVPVNGAFSTSATGGTLAAGTYYYRVSAINSVGETLASTETSQVTTGTTSTVTITWAAVTGAIGYKVYGRSTGAELFMGLVGAVTTFTDDGSITPAGPLPTVNATSPGFSYTMLSTPATDATVAGYYTTNTPALFTGTRDDKVTGGVLNGVLLLNNPANGLFYWAGDPAVRLRKVPNYNNRADVARPFKNFIVFLGSTVDGIKKPHNVMWSTSANPGSIPTGFVATQSNDSGEVDVAETPGWVVDCLPLGDVNIIYKQDARYSMQYIGGNEVFRFQRLPGNDGLLARNCVANTPKGHVFLSNGDVRIHNGGESVSIADGRIRKWLYSTADSMNAKRAFVCLNPQKTEVWIVFPSFGQDDCDTIAAWNWEADTWGIRRAPSLTCGVTGLIAKSLSINSWISDVDSWASDVSTWLENEFSPNENRLILGAVGPKIGLAETGISDFGAQLSWMLERVGLALDDPDSIKTFSASRPQVMALQGTVIQVSHGSSMTADGVPAYVAPVPFTVGVTNWANAFAQGGRYLSYKLEGYGPQIVTMRSFDVDFKKMGRF